MVDQQTPLGELELDAVIGNGRPQALVSLTERTSCLTLIAKVPTKEAEGVIQDLKANFDFSHPYAF